MCQGCMQGVLSFRYFAPHKQSTYFAWYCKSAMLDADDLSIVVKSLPRIVQYESSIYLDIDIEHRYILCFNPNYLQVQAR